MKKKVIPFLFSLFLLAGCEDPKPEPCPEGQHKYGDWNIIVPEKCSGEGRKERKCAVCGTTEVIDGSSVEHEYVDAADQSSAVAATCKEKGIVITECKNCGAKSTREVEKTAEHNFVDAEDQTGAVNPTCKDAGTVITQCSVCGAQSTRVADKLTTHTYGEWETETGATHSAKGTKKKTCSVCGDVQREDIEKDPTHTFGETPTHIEADHDLIGYDVYTCAADNVRKIVWNANDVSDDTINKKYNNEDNYKVDGEGVKFGGRPVGNAINLPASWMDHTSVYNEKVPGAFVEYKVNLKTAISGAQLIADMQPAGGLDAQAGLFLSAAEGTDWTPGLVADESEKGYKITEFRYVIEVNGVEVALDASKNIAANDATARGWYNLPCTVDLMAGINTIKIIQAGGWEPTFYNFGVISANGIENVTPDASEGFEVKFTKDANVTNIQVYEDKKCEVEDNADVHYSRVDCGRKSKENDGQVSFKVECAEGYQVKSITPVAKNGEEEPYKNIKGPNETCLDTDVNGVFRITKIADDLDIEIETEPVDTVYEGNTVTFVGDEHVTIEIYNSKVYAPSCKIEGLVATSVDETFNRPVKKDGQVYFKLIFEEGYGFDEGLVTKDNKDVFNKIKGPGDTDDPDGYRLTKVKASGTVTIHSKEL